VRHAAVDTPRWSATTPTISTNATFGYPLLAPDKAVHSYVYRASTQFGTYNHGPMISYHLGLYWMEWYNGVDTEGVENRVLYATSEDAVTWSRPAVMFNATHPTGVENEPQVLIGGERLYSIAGSWDVNNRTGLGAEHNGPDTPFMRRVHGATSLGPVFWLGQEVPKGYEMLGYPTYLEMDPETKADASSYLAALVDLEPVVDWGKPNERTLYELPGDQHRLMMLLRTGGVRCYCTKTPCPGTSTCPGDGYAGTHMLASTCVLKHSPSQPIRAAHAVPATPEPQHVCRPGTGLWNTGLPGDRMPTGALGASHLMQAGAGPWPGYRPIPVGRHCNWTEPVATTIPDSNTRACTAPLPDGRIFLVGNQISRGRDPLTLSISKDGLNFNEVYALRHCGANSTDGTDVDCRPRFSGGGKLPGFQYPSAMWRLHGPRGPEILFSYSVNKEDIALTRFPLSVLSTNGSSSPIKTDDNDDDNDLQLAPAASMVTVDNTKPRTDTEGAIVNAHQGHITRFEQLDGSWRYYWVGSAWTPCEPVAGKCVDGQPVTTDGECRESKTNGCLSMVYGACGFNNNNLSIYSNAELVNDNWRRENSDAVPRANRAVGEYWEPNFEYNPTTSKYVLWWLYSKPDTTLGLVQVGLADTPAGPYTLWLANHNV
jgi:hypothetical protein